MPTDPKNAAVEPAAPKITLFELTPEEKLAAEQQAKQFAERGPQQEAAAAEQQALRKAVFDALVAKYPPSIGNNGLRVWRHADLGEAAYIEVAINGQFFDPRAQPGYRPDLDVPQFGAPNAAVFLRG
ncbi:MAG TPA: hypothetical protein PLD20_24390 [Blastocatellia bacterium]|nr:hypothetical protein [Blastocatellia bacterium]HMY75187.1 hypothetical protein [Blastocatellia bacterium]HMZ21095.1 hypothetical protein [Blastocatellia bacterium]HNG34067.1 hypothetical protein [Blastocatellia bacterium]